MAGLRRHLLLGLPIVVAGLAVTAAVLWLLAFCTVKDLQPHVDGSSSPAASPDAGPVPRFCFAVSDGVRLAIAGAMGALIGYSAHMYIYLVYGGCHDDSKKAARVVPIRGGDDAEATPGS